jgi:N-acetylglucosaminyldiphosphoundecaprenol N-acetyl-beta-D-mannosaminyltransferase
MESKELLKLKVSLGNYASFVETIISKAASRLDAYYICVANVHMMIEAYESPLYAEIVNKANLVTPDGHPIIWALRFLHGIKQDRVAGMDLVPDLLYAAEKMEIPIAFYGGSQEMLDKARFNIKRRFPNLIVACLHSPPFRTLTADEIDSTIKMLNDSGARLIFVALGCPKQEKWMAAMQGKIHAVMIGVGGALPVLAGVHKRAPKWMQRKGLEWLFRLGQEPRRLFRRYAKTNTMFIYLTLKEKLIGRKNFS